MGWTTGLIVLFAILFSVVGQNETEQLSPRFVIVGKSGSGKSSLANALLGCDPNISNCPFNVCHSMVTCTKNTAYGTGPWLGTGPNITVLDTAGFGESEGKEKELVEEMVSILDNTENHADIILWVIKGTDSRFFAEFEKLNKRLSATIGIGWWDNVVISVSFWPFDQNSINNREQVCDYYPDSCKNEAWLESEVNDQLKKKVLIENNIPLVFIDSNANDYIDDHYQQSEWKKQMNKLFGITTKMAEKSQCKTRYVEGQENNQHRIEMKWSNENLTDLLKQINKNQYDIAKHYDFVAEVEYKATENEVMISQNKIQLNEHEEAIKNFEASMRVMMKDIPDQLSMITTVPLGTITAWVTKPEANGRSINPPLPDGWVRCDGGVIPAPSIWEGKKTPNINGEKRFLRGGSDDVMLTKQEDCAKLHDHSHKDSDHYHTASSSSKHGHEVVDDYYDWDDHAGGIYKGGSYWQFSNDGGETRTTEKASIGKVETTVNENSSGLKGVNKQYPGADETRPKNIIVIYIMRVW